MICTVFFQVTVLAVWAVIFPASYVFSGDDSEQYFRACSLPESCRIEGQFDFVDVAAPGSGVVATQNVIFQVDGDRKHLFYKDRDFATAGEQVMQVELRIEDGQQLAIDIMPENGTSSCRGFFDAKKSDAPWYRFLAYSSVAVGRSPWDDYVKFASYFDSLESVEESEGEVVITGKGKYGHATAVFKTGDFPVLQRLQIQKTEGDLFGAGSNGRIVGKDYPTLKSVSCELEITATETVGQHAVPKEFNIAVVRTMSDGTVLGLRGAYTSSVLLTGDEAAKSYSAELISPLPAGAVVTMADSDSGLAYAWNGDAIAPVYTSSKLSRSPDDASRSSFRAIAIVGIAIAVLAVGAFAIRSTRMSAK
ncbi:hypothetical protein CGZ80_12135 [Rhodopirellula sp. MGV]|nr:hypothetical protein CGZ80_12135 [Rhodopirellula sp. MGV]